MNKKYAVNAAAIVLIATLGLVRVTSAPQAALGKTSAVAHEEPESAGAQALLEEQKGSSKSPQREGDELFANLEIPPEAIGKLKKGDLPLEVSVSPSCGRRGDRLIATLKSVQGSHVSLGVAYSNGHNYGEWYAGPTDSSGTLTFPWVVPAAAPAGQGFVLVAGHDPGSDRSSTNGTTFRVIEGGTC